MKDIIGWCWIILYTLWDMLCPSDDDNDPFCKP
jgi:hypothetical protein